MKMMKNSIAEIFREYTQGGGGAFFRPGRYAHCRAVHNHHIDEEYLMYALLTSYIDFGRKSCSI